jgi:hypothetical protein
LDSVDGMAPVVHITGHVRIVAPLGRVFDTIADSRKEPSFNPAMTAVELLTPLPIGRGTRFRALMGKSRMEMFAELTEFERPQRLGSRTTAVLPLDQHEALQCLRVQVVRLVLDAVEMISYETPAFTLHGRPCCGSPRGRTIAASTPCPTRSWRRTRRR